MNVFFRDTAQRGEGHPGIKVITLHTVCRYKWGPVACSCEHGNETSGSLTGLYFLDSLAAINTNSAQTVIT
jgi:hypothetical protein